MNAKSTTLFGGPDKPKNFLREALLRHIEAVPSNGRINWMCYYFHEPMIFNALLTAAQRGVKIELIIDSQPRCPAINDACISTFKNHPKIQLTLVKSKPLWESLGINWHAHMHSKMFYFSHPTPHVLIGSYNPTSDGTSIDKQLIEKIGDHTVSHNVLINIEDNESTNKLLTYFNRMQSARQRKWIRSSSLNNQSVGSAEWTINFLPRFKTHPITKLLEQKDSQSIIRCAISHLKGPGIIKPLIKASKSGAQVELILDSTQRRVSKYLLTQLELHNIKYKQLSSSNHALMHNKFIIYKSDTEHSVYFGSFNWSVRSWRLNHEIIVSSKKDEIVSAFESRWQEMLAMD